MSVLAVIGIVAFLYFQFFKVAKESDKANNQIFAKMQAEIDRLERLVDKRDAEIRSLNRQLDRGA